ncbi:hypothetical protein BD408DRAFT_150405 [Parasitella parasitica]|nr:hypothetical protein BD408DRAFT_150405 [Parasitella parasitica]
MSCCCFVLSFLLSLLFILLLQLKGYCIEHGIMLRAIPNFFVIIAVDCMHHESKLAVQVLIISQH